MSLIKGETEVKKDLDWFMEQMKSMTRVRDTDSDKESWYISEDALLEALDQLDEPEVLSQEWIDEHRESTFDLDLDEDFETVFIKVEDLKNLLVPEQEEVLSSDWIDDNSVYASFDGLTGEYVHVDDLKALLVPKQEEQSTETVADVVTTFWKSYERLKEVMSMEVKELEE